MKKIIVLILSALVFGCAGLKKANDFYRQQDYESAIAQCQQAIAEDSLNAEAFLIMGKSYQALGKIDEAMSALQPAYQIQPYTKTTAKAADELIAIRSKRADDFTGEKQFRRAIAEYREILELDSTHVTTYLKLGGYYKEIRLLDRANFYFQKASQFDSTNSVISKQLGSIDSLTRAAETNFQTGMKNYKKRWYKTALKYFNRALKNKADHKEAKYYSHITQGKILYRKGSKSNCWDAIEHYGKAMMIHPDWAEPHFLMAQAYEKKDRNEFENAIDEYKIALEKEPNGPLAARSKQKIRALKARRDKLKKFWGK